MRLGNIYVNINEWMMETGEPPAIIKEELTQKSAERLRAWYWNNGWFDAETSYEILPKKKNGLTLIILVNPKKPYVIDSLTTTHRLYRR